MPRKAFEEQPYDPIRADLVRDVAAAGRLHPGRAAQPLSMPPLGLPPGRPSPEPSSRMREVHHPGPMAVKVPTHELPVSSVPPVTLAASVPACTEPMQTKRFLLSRAEIHEVNLFLLRLQQQTGVKVNLSVIVRGLLTVALQAEEALAGEVARRHFRQPSSHDRLGLSEFEDQWRECLAAALRRKTD